MNLNDHVNIVREFMGLAGQNAPESITTPSESERILRAKLVFEEAMELIRGLGIQIKLNNREINDVDQTLSWYDSSGKVSYVANPSDHRDSFNLIEVCDGMADLFWVGVAGVAVMCGVDLCPVLEEVDRSNMSKFIDGHRREDGKWVKGKSWSPPDIKGVLKDIK